MKKDIASIDDIKQMVDSFYDEIKSDDLLGPIFNGVIKDNWPKHLVKMYGFWQSILFGTPTYSGSAFDPHAQLPIEKKHFERWLFLFESSMDKQFAGAKANEAKTRARRIAEVFYYKIEYAKGNTTPDLL